jgi:hypothetical protein
MNIPNKIKIGVVTYRIDITELPADRDGETDSEGLVIRINKKLSPIQQESILFHEIICHAINSCFGDGEVWHVLSASIADQLHTVLVENQFLK